VHSDHERARQRHALEKLHLAVSTLVGTGSVRERLAEAYLQHLSPISVSHFPKELREETRAIQTALSGVPVEYEGQGRMRSTLNAMSDEEACYWPGGWSACSTTWWRTSTEGCTSATTRMASKGFRPQP
jgi:hypothetical protein